MEWYVILALAIGTPMILFLEAFVWHLNDSGLYQAIRDTRQQRKRLA